MTESIQQSRTCTDAPPLHREVPTLRPVGIPTETLRIEVPPRPAPPKQKLTARPLGRDLADYTVSTPENTTPAPAPRKTRKRVAPVGREISYGPVDLYDQHAAYAAFGAA